MAENQVTEKGNDAAEIEGAAEAEKSLEELLKEYPEDEQPKATPKATDNDLADRLARIEAIEAGKELKTAVDQTVEVLVDHEGYEGTPKRLARGFLHALAEENPSFQRAFQNRSQNPDAWKKATQWAAKEFRKEYQPKGDDIAGDLKAARASARGQSEQPERKNDKYKGKTPEEIRNMPSHELKQFKRSFGRS